MRYPERPRERSAPTQPVLLVPRRGDRKWATGQVGPAGLDGFWRRDDAAGRRAGDRESGRPLTLGPDALLAESEAGATACRIRDLPTQSPSASTPLRPAWTLDVRRAQLSRCRRSARQLRASENTNAIVRGAEGRTIAPGRKRQRATTARSVAAAPILGRKLTARLGGRHRSRRRPNLAPRRACWIRGAG